MVWEGGEGGRRREGRGEGIKCFFERLKKKKKKKNTYFLYCFITTTWKKRQKHSKIDK